MMLNNSFIPFARADIGEEEIQEVVDSMRSGWLTTGPKAKIFEADFLDFLGGGGFAIAVNSATAGLHLALEALGIGPGDEVITTTHTFTATAEVIRYLGADPVFIDIDEDTLCIDSTLIEGAISPRTKAIIPVHFAGRAVDMSAILKIAKSYNIYVVEDAAHALPTTYDGELVGTLASDVTVFSFYANKTITTAEGGMIVTRNQQIAERVKVMRLHGINRDAFNRFVSDKPSWYYEVVAPGYKYNMTDISASIGIHQLRKCIGFSNRRAEISESYNQAFKKYPVKCPASPLKGDTHSWHLYVVRLDDSVCVSRDQVIENLFSRGIGCSVHYIPLHLQPYWRDRYKLNKEKYPVSQRAYERSISLPIYSLMSDYSVQRVIDAFVESIE